MVKACQLLGGWGGKGEKEDKCSLQYCITLEVNEARCIVLFVVSVSIKKLFTIDFVNICLLSIFF